MTKVWSDKSLANQVLKHFGGYKFGKFTTKLLDVSWSHSKLADESLANFINLPNLPNFSHSKLLLFMVNT